MWHVNTPNKLDVYQILVQCWLTICDAGPASNQHWLVLAGLRSIAAALVLLTAGGDYKSTSTQCLFNVGPASPVLASIQSALVSASCWRYRHAGGTGCWRYRHDALNQSWVNVGLPPVTLAHIQLGAKRNTVTQYWADVGSAS